MEVPQKSIISAESRRVEVKLGTTSNLSLAIVSQMEILCLALDFHSLGNTRAYFNLAVEKSRKLKSISFWLTTSARTTVQCSLRPSIESAV